MAALTAIKGTPDSTPSRSAEDLFSLPLAPFQPTCLPSCFKKCRRRPLTEGAVVCTKGKSAARTSTTQKLIPSLGPPAIALGGLCVASAGQGTGSPSFSEPSFFQLWKANHSICALSSPGLLWGSNEIMYVKSFVNCKMLYKCKGLL